MRAREGLLLVLVLLVCVGGVVSTGLCDEYPCCDLKTSSDGCSITNMPASPSTLVLPGGETRCIYSGSGPFAFQVWPGSSSHLVINFQGGGACWDKSSTSGALCTLTVTPEPEIGAFDRQNDKNEFAKFTIVYINYCSGDMHAGNIVRPYNDPTGKPVQQTGIANVDSVLNWIENQQKTGGLSNKFDEFVIMGDSAGALAAQVWGSTLLERFSYEKAAVIPDSYIGVFPPGSQGPLIYNFGACSTEIFDEELYKKCMNQELTLQDIIADTLPKYPDIPFAFLQSKTDAVQISFYAALALSTGKNPILTQSKFYSLANEIMESYNDYPNFIVYEVDGGHHTFTPMSVYYSAGPLGAREEISLGAPLLHEWVNTLPFHSSTSSISSICEAEGEGKNDYCSSGVVPKTYPAQDN